MLSILLIWIILGLYSCIIGRFFLKMICDSEAVKWITADIIIAFGFVCINLYAQIVSLFSGQGFGSFIGLTIITIIALSCTIFIYNNRAESFGKINRVDRKRLLICVICVLGVLVWTNTIPTNYDTYLYHAQAIHWAEYYKVIPGLGNLHYRFAYNSAFMTMQALWSFFWVNEQSMHAINGFVTICFLIYNCSTLNRTKSFFASDWMKLCMLAYIAYDRINISSPNTDTLALLLISYIVIKWTELTEVNCDNCDIYALLCILCVYAATIKLSAGAIAVLTIAPAIYLIKQKRLAKIIIYIFSGIAILVPYLIRNIIISGFVIYPYEKTQFGEMDWRMSVNDVHDDRADIIAWARGTMDVSRNSESIWKWFPDWYASIHIVWKILFVIAMVSIIGMLVTEIYCFFVEKRPKGVYEYTKDLGLIVGLVFWMFSAPLPRYGAVYLLLIMGNSFYRILSILGKKLGSIQKLSVYVGRLAIPLYTMAMILYLGLGVGASISDGSIRNLLVQTDYNNPDMNEIRLDGMNTPIYVPTDLDSNGYNPFPATPFSGRDESVEWRGESIEEGFKLKWM